MDVLPRGVDAPVPKQQVLQRLLRQQPRLLSLPPRTQLAERSQVKPGVPLARPFHVLRAAALPVIVACLPGPLAVVLSLGLRGESGGGTAAQDSDGDVLLEGILLRTDELQRAPPPVRGADLLRLRKRLRHLRPVMLTPAAQVRGCLLK